MFSFHNRVALVSGAGSPDGIGRTVNIESITGPLVGIDGTSACATAKPAISAMARAVALESGRDGITCNAVQPGRIATA
ncbi:hypothetical protein GCM10010873_15250 [Cypionkella aquatica]|uniref:Uncharacterized protein n=1 Tax=Cypionkella aquatica TaxID=1756042 RepID=A0AA37U0L5_9RHOB|nr:SDR family oxidoreductase [Cypionkella aquatica]GLS86551.1 hypothetical protein GCM10010873_15250 [Cypionkella aquatica]